MADLADFFAKRDKKKSKSKKFETTDDLAKVLEQKAKEKKKLETGKSNYLPEGGRQSPGPGLPVNDDDEWLEAEDKKPDFSNLKIQELVLSDEDDEDPNHEVQDGEDGANDSPWNKRNKPKDKEEETKEEKKDDEEQEDANKDKAKVEEKEENKTPPQTESGDSEVVESAKEETVKKYIPPGMRNKQEVGAGAAPTQPGPKTGTAAPGAGKYVPPSMRGTAGGVVPAGSAAAPLSTKKKGAVPTLGDEESFPSLS